MTEAPLAADDWPHLKGHLLTKKKSAIKLWCSDESLDLIGGGVVGRLCASE